MSARAKVHSQVAQSLEESAARMKRQADGHRRDTSLLVGQKVWLATGNLPLKHGARKLAARWAGPYLLTEQVAQEAWRVQIPQ